MTRETLAHSTRRGMHSTARGCGAKYYDHNLMQTVDVNTQFSETHTKIERWQPLGLSCVPLKQKQQQGAQQQAPLQAGGGSGDSSLNYNQPKGECAELPVMYIGGDHSHPIAIATDDRRVRPYDKEEGDTCFYHAAGSEQMMYMNDKGISVTTNNNQSVKDKQQQGQGTGGGGGGGGGGLSARLGAGGGGSSKANRWVKTGHVKKEQPQTHKIEEEDGGETKQPYKHHGTNNMVHHYTEKQKTLYVKGKQSSEDGVDGATNVAHYNSDDQKHVWDPGLDSDHGKTQVSFHPDLVSHKSGGDHDVKAAQNIVHQAGGSSSYNASGSLFVGGSSTHLHGQIIAEPINLGHRSPISLARRLGAKLDATMILGDVADSGMTMTTSTSSATPPSIPELNVPYDGFRWIDTTSGIEYSYYQGIWAEGGGKIAFPSSPAIDQVFNFGQRQWRWNGIGWQATPGIRNTDVRSVSGAVTVDISKLTTLTLTGNATITLAGSAGQSGLLLVLSSGSFTTTLANGNSVVGTTAFGGNVKFNVWHDGVNFYAV